MNRAACLSAAVALGVALGLFAANREPLPVQAQPGKSGQWEYKVVPVGDLMPSALKQTSKPAPIADEAMQSFNKLGADGWEVVYLQTQMEHVVFKRLKK